MDISIITRDTLRPRTLVNQPKKPHKEYHNKTLVMCLLRRDDISEKTRSQLTHIVRSMDIHETINVSVKKRGNNSVFGRLQPQYNSLTTLPRKERNTLCHNYYYDIDMVNAHFSILASILENCNQDKPEYNTLKDFIEHREEFIARLNQEHGEKEWKTIIISLLYGGQQTHGNRELLSLRRELQDIFEYLKELHRRNDTTFWNFIKRVDICDEDLEEGTVIINNNQGKFMYFYLATYETDIMDEVFNKFLYKDYYQHYYTYEYDGFKIWKKSVDNHMGGIERVMNSINQHLSQKWKYVRYISKEMTDRYYIEPNDLAEMEEMSLDLSTDRKKVDFIERYYGDKYIFQDKIYYYFDGGRWKVSLGKCHYLYDNLYLMMKNYINVKMPNLYCIVEEDIQKLEQDSVVGKVYNGCISRFNKPDIEFDTDEYLLGFNNGLVDLETGIFRLYKTTDYMVKTVKYDYEYVLEEIPNEVVDGESIKLYHPRIDVEVRNLVWEILRKIQPKAENLKLYLQMYASMLCGKNVEKFFILTGSGRNGKGLMNQIISKVLGDYGYYIEPGFLSKDLDAGSGPNPAIANMHQKRGIIIKEPKRDKKLWNNNIKTLTGGGQMNARKCSSNETEVKQTGTYVIEANGVPELLEEPSVAETQRIINIPFLSSFEDFHTRDDYVNHRYVQHQEYKDEEFIKRIRMQLMFILLEVFKEWRENDYRFSIPESIVEASTEYLKKSNIHECMEDELFKKGDIYEKCSCEGDCKIHKIYWSDIEMKIRDSNIYRDATSRKTEKLIAKHFIPYLQDTKGYKTGNAHPNKSIKQTYILGYVDINERGGGGGTKRSNDGSYAEGFNPPSNRQRTEEVEDERDGREELNDMLQT